MDTDTVLELILDGLAELVDYELAVVLGLDDHGGLRVRKAKGPLYTKKLEGYYINLELRQDLQAILETNKPYLFDTATTHVDTYHDILDLPEGHSCLVAPLSIRGQVLGLLTFDHRLCNQFSPGIVRFVGSMSRLIAMALAQTDLSNNLALDNHVLLEERNRLLAIHAQGLKGLIGTSKAWQQVLEQVPMAANSQLPVLIRGETGTGKEGIAQALHQLSSRRNGPFIAVNCSALSETMAESELFGHEKGAFTGAVAQRRGRFELANGGTLFLDEIGDLPLGLQAKVLRAIQEGSFERLGGEKTIRVDVRIIAASHVDFEAAIARGAFRQDLFYRLNVYPLWLPPLRNRREDIPLLTNYFLHGIRERNHLTPQGTLEPCPREVLEWLEQQAWPGNIRELQNTLERAMVLAGSGPLSLSHLLHNQVPTTQASSTNQSRSTPEPVPTWDEGTRALIQRALDQCQGRIYGPQGAAALLGLKPSTLQGKMAKLGL